MSVSPTCSPRTSSAVGPAAATSIRSRGGVASAVPAARATSSPSMNSTIFSSPPSFGTSVPTSRPSRSTVARSQWAITSRRRWVMKSAERPRSFWRRITSKTRSARSDGSAAVISSRIRSCGSRASARARSSIRSSGSGRSSACSAKSTSRSRSRRCRRTSADRRPRQAQVLPDRQVGHERRILEDGCEPDPRRLGGRGDAARLAVDEDRPSVRPDHAGQHLHERALAGAVRPEQGVHLARLDDEGGRLQRDDRAVALRHLACGQEAHAWVREGAPDGAPSLFTLGVTAPCSPRAGLPCTSSTA